MNEIALVKKTRNAPKTKARILAVAQRAFAGRGYAYTSIRDIAGEAGVAPSLLMRHFGSKPALFREAILYGLYHDGFTDVVFKGPKKGFGERMIRLALNEAEVELITILVLATGDDDARAITSDVAREHIVNGMADWLGPPRAYARALNIVMLLNGFTLFARQLGLDAVPEESSAWMAQTLQTLVDEGDNIDEPTESGRVTD